MASDYGRGRHDDDGDDINPRNRRLDQDGSERGQLGFGGNTYPGHDYWGQAPDAGASYGDRWDQEPPVGRDRAFDDRVFDERGYDTRGYDAQGYDVRGFDTRGYDARGYDARGYDARGYDARGYNDQGFNDQGYNDRGYNDRGYNDRGYDDRGYNDRGYDDRGYNDRGYNDRGYDDRGYDDRGYDERGRDGGRTAQGYTDRTGYDDRGAGFADRGTGYVDRGSGYSDRGTHQSPGYQDPRYQDPGYQGSGHQGPRYQAPRHQQRDDYDDDRGGYSDDRGYGASRGYDRSRSTTGGRSRANDDDDSATTWRSKVRKKRKNMPLWQELPLLLVVAFCLAVLIRTFLVQAFYIPSGSMEETLAVGDRVLVNKVLYDVREPERGEVVVFEGPATWAPENQVDKDAGFFAELGRTVGDLVGFSQPGEKDFIKRVIGLPGDTVACCDVEGRVTVNGHPLDESAYVYDNSPLDAVPNPRQCTARRFDPVKVEPGQMFVMGDHRGVSQDSRCQGQVPIDNVIGRAFVILWPSDRWGWLPVPETFKTVPKNALGPPGPKVTTIPELPFVPDVILAPLAVSLTVSTRSARQERLRRRRW